jgi:hypothetical protein
MTAREPLPPLTLEQLQEAFDRSTCFAVGYRTADWLSLLVEINRQLERRPPSAREEVIEECAKVAERRHDDSLRLLRECEELKDYAMAQSYDGAAVASAHIALAIRALAGGKQ